MDYTFGAVDKDAAESLAVELNLFTLCSVYWAPNEIYSSGQYVRPTRPTGFAYECTTGGTTGAREPRDWPTTLTQTITDGSVVWTCRAASTNGVNAITSPSATSDPTGLTISSVSVSESTKILATYSGGTLGQDYDAVFSFTLDGVTRIARQTVRIRKL